MRVLLIEDDEFITETLATCLTEQHYIVDVAADGQAGWEYVEIFTYDLILMDVMLPKIDGISLCRKLRDHKCNTPILLLTARDNSADKVIGLDAGADDYIVKPFNFQELSARIRAILRRGTESLSPILEWGDLLLNPNTCEVSYHHQPINLTPKEYGILELFLRHPQRVFSRRAILDHLWAFEEIPAEDTVRAHIKGLRQKLKAAHVPADLIETIYGIGYRLKTEWVHQEDKENKDHKAQDDRESDTPEEPQLPTPPPPSDPAPQLNQAVAKIWERFKGNINARIEVLEKAVIALQANELSAELQGNACQEAHKLAGALGTFGVAAGSQIARELEQLLHTEIRLQTDTASRFFDLVASLRHQLDQKNQAAATEQSIAGSQEPLSSSEPSQEFFNPSLLDAQYLSTPLLLVINDDPLFTEPLVVEAAKHGLRVEVTQDLFAAQEVIAFQRLKNPALFPDVVLLDLDMGDTSNEFTCQACYQLLAKLANNTPPVPVLVLTNRGDFSQRLEVARLGGHGFLQKPVMPVQVVEAALEVWRQAHTTEAKVMIVDDDAILLAALRGLLEPWGIKTVTLDDPRQFWETLEMAAPDLLVLDVQMPHLNGMELCQVVRTDRRWSRLPVLFLSAYTDAEIIRQVFAVGADDFVTKPITGQELASRIFSRLNRMQSLNR